jgi:hypothetical protein
MSASIWFLAITDALKLQAFASFMLLAANRNFPLAASLAVYLAGATLFSLLRRRRRAVYIHTLVYVGLWAVAQLALIGFMFRLPLSVGSIVALAR